MRRFASCDPADTPMPRTNLPCFDRRTADVLTMNQANDIDVLHDRGNLIPADWANDQIVAAARR